MSNPKMMSISTSEPYQCAAVVVTAKDSSGRKNMVPEKCLCGSSDCVGLSSAFRVLGRKDPRSNYHRIPRRMSKKHDAKDRAAIEAMRAAYLMTLFPEDADRPKLKVGTDYFIAKHHFPPGIVLSYQKLPYTLPDNVLLEHKVNLNGMHALGTLLSGHHPCEKSLMIVPNYPIEQARQDLQSLLNEEERARLFESRERVKRSSSSGSLKRLLRQTSSSSLGKQLTLTREYEDDPTETTCSMDSVSSFMSPTADMDLWYEQSQRIALPPTPLVRPELEEDGEDEGLLPMRSVSGCKARSLEEVLVDGDSFSSSLESSPREDVSKVVPEEFALLGQTDPQRPRTAASTEVLPTVIFDALKCAKVRRLSNRKAVARKDEFKYLILHGRTRTSARRPKIGVLSVESQLGDDFETKKETRQRQMSSSASVLSTLAALASLSGDDEPVLALAPSPSAPLAPFCNVGKPIDSDEESSESEGSTSYVATKPWAVPYGSNRSLSSCSSDEDCDALDNAMRKLRRNSLLDENPGYESEASLTLPEALENTGTEATPWHAQKRITPRLCPNTSLREIDSALRSEAIGASDEQSWAGHAPSEESAPLQKTEHASSSSSDHVSKITHPVSGSESSQADLDSIPAADLLAGVLGEDSIFALPEREQADEVYADDVQHGDASDSSTDSGMNSISSGTPYNPPEGTGKSENAAPQVPSGVLVTVLETAHLNTLLGDEDEDSDFEEKWAKANRQKKGAVSSAPVSAKRKTTSTSNDIGSELPDLVDGTLTPAQVGGTVTSGPAAFNGKPVSESRKSIDEGEHDADDSRVGSFVEDLWDSVDGNSNAVDALANLLEDDFDDHGHEIDVLEFERTEGASDTSDVSCSSSSSSSDESSSASGNKLRMSDCAEINNFGSTAGIERQDGTGSIKQTTLSKPSNAVDAEFFGRSVTTTDEDKPITGAPHQRTPNCNSAGPAAEEAIQQHNILSESNGTADSLSLSKKTIDTADLDISRSTKDASCDEDSEYSQPHSQCDTLTAEDTTEGSHAVSTMSSIEEQEELAYLDMLKVEEDERHTWFSNTQNALHADYHVYVQILATMSFETDQVNRLMDFSHQAIDVYAKTIAEVCSDFVSLSPDEAGKKMDVLLTSYQGLSSRFEESLPGLEECVREMETYKSELNRSVRVIQNRGYFMLREMCSSEELVRKSWAILEEASPRIRDDFPSSTLPRDRWLEEVDYRQAVTKHLSLWRERTNDLKDLTSRVLEMEHECHQRLKEILLRFLPKRRDLFVGVRDLLDPAVDALEASALLSEMGEVDKRLEQAILYFQPEKKRSILSLVSSSSAADGNHPSPTSLDEFSSLAGVDTAVLNKSDNVLSYSFIKSRSKEEWENVMAVVTRQHFLHTYLLPTSHTILADGASDAEIEAASQVALENDSPPLDSIGLISCDFEQHEECVEICYEKECSETDNGKDGEEGSVEKVLHLRFESCEEASRWLSEAKKLFAPVEDTVEQNDKTVPVTEIVRV